MRAMDYIRSVDICYLICDTLKLIDKHPIEHGMRVAYMLMRLLESKGGYDEYEMAEFVFLAMIHDIGAYRTEDDINATQYDTPENGNSHATYGSVFLKNVSPFGERADVLRYHHMPYSQISKLNYSHTRVAAYLSLLEDVDALYCKEGTKMNLRSFETGAGKQYASDGVVSLLKCIRREGMLTKIESGEYEKELRQFMEYILFTNEEKENYIYFLMQCCGLKGKLIAVESIMCSCIVEVIAEEMGLSGREKDKLGYSAMLRNVGMLNLDKKELKALRETETREPAGLKNHVKVGYDLLKKHFTVQEIAEIVAAHHERLDGSGYPDGKRENQMTVSQQIMQVADYTTMLMNKRKDKQPLAKKQIIDILLRKADRKQLNERAIQCVVSHYDMIERRIHSETKDYLEMYVRINNMYKLLSESNVGETV